MVQRYRPLERRSFGGAQGGRRYEGHPDEDDRPVRQPRREEPENDMRVSAKTQIRGEIVTLREGFGWIRGDDGVDRFFHKSGLFGFGLKFDELHEGQAVLFTEIAGEKGPRAIEIRAAGAASEG